MLGRVEGKKMAKRGGDATIKYSFRVASHNEITKNYTLETLKTANYSGARNGHSTGVLWRMACTNH